MIELPLTNEDHFFIDILQKLTEEVEYPIFAESAFDMRERHFRRGDDLLTISPSPYGLATIADRKILLAIISQALAAVEVGIKVDRLIPVMVPELLAATEINDKKQERAVISLAFRRLIDTKIKTTIKRGEHKEYSLYHFLGNQFHIFTDKGRIFKIVVDLPIWIMNIIKIREMSVSFENSM